MPRLAVLLAAAAAGPAARAPSPRGAAVQLAALAVFAGSSGSSDTESAEDAAIDSQAADEAFFNASQNFASVKRTRVWDEPTLSRLVANLQKEVAGLRTELAWLRLDNQVLRGQSNVGRDAGPPGGTRRPPPDPDAAHGSTLFITMCAGTLYFDTYCGPLFASFERAYGAAAARHRIAAFYVDVDEGLLAAAKERFSPWLRVVALPQDAKEGMKGGSAKTYGKDTEGKGDNVKCMFAEGRVTSCRVQEEAQDNRDFKTMIDSLWFPWRIARYLKENADGFCYMAVMDSDVLFVNPLGHYLPDCSRGAVLAGAGVGGHGGGADWDVAFTVYDEHLKVPWAEDPAKVGRTKNGLTRLNCGLVLVSLRDVLLARRFMSKWAHVSHQLLTAGEGSGEESDGVMWKIWQTQLEDDFRGNDQAGLVLLTTAYDTSRLESLLGWGPGACEVCSRSVEARLDLFQDELPLPIRFRGLPARILNHPESMVDGVFPPGLRILHLKGLWWRMALGKGVLFWDATRRPDWHRDALALQRLVSETWQLALRPEDKIQTQSMQIFDGEGKNVTNQFFSEVKGGGSVQAA